MMCIELTDWPNNALSSLIWLAVTKQIFTIVGLFMICVQLYDWLLQSNVNWYMIGLFMICFHWFDWLLQSNVNWYVIVMDTVTVRLQILAYVCTVSITLLVSDMSIICLLCLCLFYVDSSEIFRFLNVYGIHPNNPVLLPEKNDLTAMLSIN